MRYEKKCSRWELAGRACPAPTEWRFRSWAASGWFVGRGDPTPLEAGGIGCFRVAVVGGGVPDAPGGVPANGGCGEAVAEGSRPLPTGLDWMGREPG